MFLRESSKNLTEAKKAEQAAVAEALLHVVHQHRAHNTEFPSLLKSRHIGDLLHMVRHELIKGSSPFLRDLCLAIFVGAPLFKPLQRAVSFLPEPTTTADLFGITRKAAEKIVEGSPHSFRYYLSHPRFLWSACMSSYIGALLFGKISPFDPKAFAKNTSGFLFKERFRDSGNAGLEIDWTVGPTPTVGNHLAQEAVAAIEALDRGDSLCFPHTMWIYINLQNIRGISEKHRSEALLHASKKTPRIFRLASVSVDAPFYKSADKKKPLEEHRRQLLHELKKGCIHPRSGWYAFSLMKGEEDEWWQCVDQVLEKSVILSETTEQKVRVFHELVVLGLIRAWQGFCCRNAAKSVISTIACKECADRGGSVNAAFTWALSHEEDLEKAHIVETVLWGRPLLSRNRLIDSSRTQGFEALVRAFEPVVVRKYLEEIWNEACQGRWQKSGDLLIAKNI